jgi:twitching motility protein PilT
VADEKAVLDLNDLLQFMVEHRGSDLHLKVGSAPHVRVDGHLMVTSHEPVTPVDTDRIAFAILPPDRAEEFSASGEADFALSIAGLGRFRVNVFRQRGTVGLVFRRVMPGLPSFDTLGLPAVVARLAEETHGLVLVTGPTGSGRTTTLAAMVDHINETRSVSIVTIEDPVEVLHTDKMAIVNQRELGSDTRDYGTALKRVLRQDPDIVVVGEITDDETMKAVLSVASTGHLVLSTMPTTRAAETISRMVDFFPPFQHRQVRVTLAGCLRGVISQALLERADGRGRVPAVEVIVGTNRVFDYIADPDAAARQLETIMVDGEYYGMQTFDQSLFGLYKNGLVSLRDVLAAATDQQEFRISLTTAGLISA